MNHLTIGDVMAKGRIAVTTETIVDEAVKLMEEKRLLNLPILVNGKVAYSITRHDLLRAWMVSESISKPIAPHRCVREESGRHILLEGVIFPHG